MIRLNELKGCIFAAGYSSVGQAGMVVGIPQATMYRKMKTGEFTMNEIDDMIEAFHIRHPEEVFVLGGKK